MKIVLGNNSLLCIFALGIAARDLIYYYFLKDFVGPLTNALINVGTISCISIVAVSIQNNSQTFAIKWKDLPTFALIGILCAYAYSFFWLQLKVTPGIFNLADYVITPSLTMVVGLLYFKEKFEFRDLLTLIVYVIGVIAIFYSDSELSPYLILISTYPIATVASDTITKKLLKSRYYLTDQILLIRFTFAFLFLGIYFVFRPEKLNQVYIAYAIISAFLFSYIPMKCLVSALRSSTFKQLAYFDILIPILTVIGSLAPIYTQFNPYVLVLVLAIVTAITSRSFRTHGG